MKNTATGRAQAKVFAVCIRQQTNTEAGHSHNLAVSAPVTATAAAPAGIHEVSLQCGPRQLAIQPGFVSTAPGDLIYSQPDGNGWARCGCRSTAAGCGMGTVCHRTVPIG